MRLGLRVALVALVLSAGAELLGVADSTPPSAAAEIQAQLGDQLFAEGRFSEALDAYQRAARANDPRLQTRARVGVVKSALRVAEFAGARQVAVQLRQAQPRDAEIAALHGDALWAAGLFDEAEQAFRDALAIDPGVSRGRHGMARVLAARSQLESALDEAQAALRLAPRDGEFHHTLGSVYERMHRFEEAAVALGNYANLLPNKDRSEKAAWSRATIRFLRSFGQRAPFEIEGGTERILHTVPFRLVRDKVVVKGRVNGGAEMDFVLDTGAEQTVISRRIAQRLGVTPIVYTLSAGVGEMGLRGLQMGRLESLQIGALTIKNVPCLIKNPPLTGMPTREGESFSPLSLGLSMTIDYQRRRLTISRSLPPEPADFELPIWLHRLAMVRGVVNGQHPVNFVVDTGGEVISISVVTASALRQTGRRIALRVYGTSGWDPDAFLLPGVDLTFSAIRFSNFPVVVLNLRAPSVLLGFELGGIVGHKFLSRFRVGLDLERSVLRLKELRPGTAALP